MPISQPNPGLAPRRAAVAAALAALALALPAAAQDPKPGEGGPDTIYIPYKDLEKVFETEGQGVFLPYREFVKLWRASRPPGLDPTAPPPVPAAITAAEYTGQVVEKVARITARYDVQVLADGWTDIPLDFGAIALSNATIEGPAGALLTTKDKRHALLAPRPGAYKLTVDLAARVDEQPGIRTLKLTVPSAPRARLDLTLPGTDLGVTLNPNLAATIGAGPAADTTRVLAFLGPAATLDIEWKPRARTGPERQPMLMARTETGVAIEEGAIQARAQVHYTILQAPAERFVLRVPREYQVLSLTGANLRAWETRDEQATRVITVTLHSPAEDRYQIDLHLERLAPDVIGDLTVPQIVAENTERERGALAIGAPGGLALSVGARQGLTQKDPGGTPKHLLPHLPDGVADLLFEYLGGTRALTVRVAKVTPRVRATVASRLDIGEARHGLETRLDLEVERAGIFTVETIIPKGWEPIDVQPEQLVDDWRLADHAEGQQLSIDLKSQRQGNFALGVRLQRRADAETGTLALPSIKVLDAEKETGFLAVAVPPGFKLTTGALTGYRPIDLGRMPGVRMDGHVKLGFTYTKHPVAGSVDIERLTAQVSARLYTTVSVKEGVLAVEYQLHYTIEHAGVKVFRFSVPASLPELRDAIKGEQVKQIGKPAALPTDATRVSYTVDLQGDVMGTYVLTVKHEQKLEKKAPGVAQSVTVPRLDALDVFSQDEHLAVTKTDNMQIEAKPGDYTGYEPRDPRELEGPMRARQGEVVLALSYAGDPAGRSLRLGVLKYEFAKTVQTAVTHLHTDAVFAGGRSIQALTILEVHNVQRPNLMLRLAPGATLQQCIVAGEVRQPSRAGDPAQAGFADLYLVDLSPPAGVERRPGAPLVVLVRWERSLDHGLQVAAPVPVPADEADQIPVALETLRLWLPEEEHSYLGVDTNMRRTDARAGLYAALTAWLGWDRVPRAEWRDALQRIRELETRAESSRNALTVQLRPPGFTPRGFLRNEGGGEVSVSYMGRTTSQVLKVLVFLGAVAGVFWLTWAQGASRLVATGAPAGAALILSAVSESITPFASALLLGALLVGVMWVAYTLLYELPAAWRSREGGGGWTPPPPPPARPEAPGGAPSSTAPPAPEAPSSGPALTLGDTSIVAPPAGATGDVAAETAAGKKKSGRSKKQGGADA